MSSSTPQSAAKSEFATAQQPNSARAKSASLVADTDQNA
jgi:hypothetical protein